MLHEQLDARHTLYHDLGINTEAIPGEAPWKLSITGVILRKRTTHIYALGQGRDAFCQECLLQAVMSHARLLEHGGYTPLQLLFGHETAPIEGEAFDDEQQNRSITVSMAERLARQQSAMKAWLQPKAESRVEQTQNRRTRVVQHWPSGARVSYWRGDVPSMGSLPTIRQGSTAILNKHKGAWLGRATVLTQEMGRSQEQHEEAHDTVWIVVQGRLLRCAPEHLRHLSERERLSIDRDKGDKEKARTFTNIVQDFRFSKGTHVDLRSQQDPLDGSEPRHLSGKKFVRTPTEMPGTSSSGMRTETRPVVEPTVVLSGTNLDNPMSTTHDSSESTPAPETDETQNREYPDMETDDPDTMTADPEPPPVSQSVPSSQLPQHRIYGKREDAVVHEKKCQTSHRVA